MPDIPLVYWNELASQTLFVSALLGGFSLAVVTTLFNENSESRLINEMFRGAVLATASFLISLFSMTRMVMMTTEGYPLKVVTEDLFVPRTIGVIFLTLGIISLLTILGLSGWTKSKKMGWFTTITAIISLFFIIAMMT